MCCRRAQHHPIRWSSCSGRLSGLLLRDLLGKFAYVVVDTPAASQGADSRVVAAACGAALVIARKGRSRMESTAALLRALSKGPSKIAGVVMNEH